MNNSITQLVMLAAATTWAFWIGEALGDGGLSAVEQPRTSATAANDALFATTFFTPAASNCDLKLDCNDEVCASVARGRAAFNARNLGPLGGNGRSCADCHMPSESFQLSPAAVKTRFDALLARRVHDENADDPLFRPIDADDFRVNGENASDYSNLVENGLVRVTMPLPANVKLLDPLTGQPTAERYVDLWRAVKPVLDVAITGPDGVAPIWPPGAPRVPIMGQDPNGPNRQGGYQHDARFATLQEQARSALFAHAQVSVEPPARMLDDLAAFQQTLFSSPEVELLALAIVSQVTPFPDPDPELTELEQQGKVVFNRACAQCHGGTLHPSMSTPEAAIVRPIVRYHNIQTACPRPLLDGFAQCPPRLQRNARKYQITLASGTVTNITTSDPGRLLLTGQIADLGVMDIPSLRPSARRPLISTTTLPQPSKKCSTTMMPSSRAWLA